MRLLTVLFALTSLLTACGPEGSTDDLDPVLADGADPLIYGSDDRREPYQLNDAVSSHLAEATMAILQSSQLSAISGGYRIDTSSTFAQSYSLCADEPYRNQPNPAFCTAFLVAPDVVATAGHCISNRDCGRVKFVFGFQMVDANTVVGSVPSGDVYSCAAVLGESETSTDDWAVVRLDRPVSGRTPLDIRRSGTISNGASLTVAGHPAGLPLKIAGGATVRDNSHPYYFSANLDTYGGNSGSPVVGADGTVEGILVRGNTDFTLIYDGGYCYTSNVCPNTGCPGWEDATRASRFAALVPQGGGEPLCDSNASCDDGDPCTVDICDPSAGCDSTPVNCGAGASCVDGACVEPAECFGDGDCTGDRVCAAGACADPCARAGCPGGLRCEEGTGRCVEADPCRRDDECRGDRYCANGACADPCREDADCPGALSCGNGRCGEADRCFGDADCLGERRCVELVCTDPCDDALPCRGTQQCVGGVCEEGPDCAADRDCLGDRRCHPEGHVCVDPCADDADCFGGRVCVDGRCGERDECQVDGNCLGDRECRLGRCRTVRCETHADCPAGERCLDWQCVAALPGVCDCFAGWACRDELCVAPGPCAADRDCPAGCAADGRCGPCAEDADCPGATSCRDAFCIEPAICLGDASCLLGRTCNDADRCGPDPACADDPLAPNDTPETAVPLAALAVTGLVACDGADDWFRVGTDATLTVTARFDADGAELLLTLYPIFDAFHAVDEARGIGQARVGANRPGEYLVRVRHLPGAPLVYDLDVRIDAECVDDRYERPWRNDEVANAAPIGVGRIDATRCGDDTDWYRFTGPAGGRLSAEGPVTATVNGRAAPIDLAPGDTIRVTGNEDADYSLLIEAVRDPVARCAAAPALVLNRATPVQVVAGADDFAPVCFSAMGPEGLWRIDLPAPGTLNADFAGQPPMGALALYNDCARPPLECSAGVGGLRAEALPAGTYYLALDGPAEGQLTARFEGDFACNDAPLLNPGPPQPIRFAPAAGLAGGCIGEGPVSVWRFRLAAPAAVTATAEGAGQLAVAIRPTCADAANELACGQGFVAAAEAGVLPAGEYAVVVQGDGAATLQLTATPAGGAPSFADACDGLVAPVAPGRYAFDDSTLGAGDDVDAAAACRTAAGGRDRVLRLRFDQPVGLQAQLFPNGFSGYLLLLDAACGGAATCGTDLNPFLNAALAPGEYALVVDGQGAGDAGAFQLEVFVNAR
ncbi:MAG: trypsin-like peptidase domain-containing protein [Myxococcales bacterium]|nr:trypsin-like peptidase domain-containing protein [Myxococcales bacterium]